MPAMIAGSPASRAWSLSRNHYHQWQRLAAIARRKIQLVEPGARASGVDAAHETPRRRAMAAHEHRQQRGGGDEQPANLERHARMATDRARRRNELCRLLLLDFARRDDAL